MRYQIVIVLFLLAIAVSSQMSLVKQRFSLSFSNPYCTWCEDSQTDEIEFIPARTLFILGAAPADPDFLADLLWLRTSYYFGAHAVTDQDYAYLQYLLNRIAELAPNWEYPYMFGGIVLHMEAGLPVPALSLVQKGIQRFPDSWQLLFLKGYILWNAFENYEQASKDLFKASQIDGAPTYLHDLSITLADRSQNQHFQNAFYDFVMDNLKNPGQKHIIRKRFEKEVRVENAFD